MNSLLRVAVLALVSLICSAQTPISVRVETPAKRAPSADATKVATLHPGETFTVNKDVPYWYQITLRSGRKAWVRKSACTLEQVEEEDVDADTAEADAIRDSFSLSDAPTAQLPNCAPSTQVADFSICPASGSGGLNARAYLQKNRMDMPCAFRELTVAELLNFKPLPKSVRALPDTDPDVEYLKSHESTPVRVEGHLAMVKYAGKEGVNCNDPSRLDLRMELVGDGTADPKTNRTEHIVTEASPWFQAQISAWDTDTLSQYSSYKGGFSGTMKRPPTKVRIYGFLFFDEAHAYDGSVGTVRGTAWELHPVVRIEVFENGTWKVIK
jgi:hypothetical protein